MFIGEKVGKEWTMDQAPQYAIDHVANSKKNVFEFEFLNSLSEKISSFFGLTSDSLFWKCETKKTKNIQKELTYCRVWVPWTKKKKIKVACCD